MERRSTRKSPSRGASRNVQPVSSSSWLSTKGESRYPRDPQSLINLSRDDITVTRSAWLKSVSADPLSYRSRLYGGTMLMLVQHRLVNYGIESRHTAREFDRLH